MPQILNRYTALDRPNYNLPIGPLAAQQHLSRGGIRLYGSPPSFSTGRRLAMSPPTTLYGSSKRGFFGSSYVNREPLAIGRGYSRESMPVGRSGWRGLGALGEGDTTMPTPTTGAQTNTGVYPGSSGYGGNDRPTESMALNYALLAGGGFLAGYLAHCLIYRKGH
jgi:hypothetical protein